MILADKDLTNWTYYVRKGKKYESNKTAKPHQEQTEISGTPGGKNSKQFYEE